MAGTVHPSGSDWALNADPGDHAGADAGNDPGEKLALEQAELSGPSGGRGAD